MRQDRKGENFKLPRNEYGLSERQFLFCLYWLASQGKKPRWAAGKAGFSGDLYKRSHNLLEDPKVKEFLDRFTPPSNKKSVTSDEKSIIKRLEEIASGEGVDKTVTAELKAIELMGRSKGMWDSKNGQGKDRLKEIVSVFRSGPAETGSSACVECASLNGPTSKFCHQCGTEIKRDEPVAVVKKKTIKEIVQ